MAKRSYFDFDMSWGRKGLGSSLPGGGKVKPKIRVGISNRVTVKPTNAFRVASWHVLCLVTGSR